jgi:hypothetical protein
VGDGLHYSAALHEVTAEPMLAAIREAIAAANGAMPAVEA